MKRVIPALVMAASLFATGGVSAQGRNFAGTWTLDVDRMAETMAAVARSGGGGGGGGMRGGGGTGSSVAAGGAVGAGGGARSGGGGGGMRGRGGAAGPMTLSLDANSFTVGSGEISTGYKLDGSVTTTDTERGQIATKAAWKGDHIVIETTAPGPNGSITTTTSCTSRANRSCVRRAVQVRTDSRSWRRRFSSAVSRKPCARRSRTERRARLFSGTLRHVTLSGISGHPGNPWPPLPPCLPCVELSTGKARHDNPRCRLRRLQSG